MQIKQHNVCHINVIVIKDMIIAIKRKEENQRLLTEKIEETMMVEIVKMLIVIEIGSKYGYRISNIDLNIA